MKRTTMIGRFFLLVFTYLGVFFYALAFTNKTGWAVLLFVSLILLMEILSLISPLRGVQISASETLIAHLGEPITPLVTIKRAVRLPLFFSRLSIHLPFEKKKQTIRHYHGQTIALSLSWSPKKRGWITKQPIERIGSDLFGWFEKTRVETLSVNWVVLPAIHPYAAAGLSFIEYVTKRDYFGDSSYTIKTYRDYQKGDPLKQIDWKTSSRKQSLILREYEKYEPVKWTFIFYGLESEYFEELLSLFYSISKMYPQQAEFLLIGENISSNEQNELENYALIQPLKTLVEIPERNHRNICLFLPEWTEEVEKILPEQKKKQFSTVVYSQFAREWEGAYEKENTN